ncbi:oxysterol binding family protein [Heterostelium album PN500]|uniref:Oxysterol binding family protein n=1 Tax=Heterostelium pallidum (strain ATCC 26659 / Pp 5 / PN500) TaxID=670386 RepID=D3B7W5_HETP5|nr:oxysterol binding family protein [Heterostelium album PN500]EFA82858.1 oxysterol binding family protein [Heterostelium album PN500]|eukprot:XP_020434975.1 oxysterol binding family protein [Heterostelium album PN500]
MGKKSKKVEVEDVGEDIPEELKKELTTPKTENALNIDEIDDQMENQSRFTVLTSVIKKIGFGADLTSMTVPGAFILPKSALSYFAEYYSSYFDILLKANEIEDKQERFIQVVKYLFTACRLPEDNMRKPLNPVLSETYEGDIIFEHEQQSDNNNKTSGEDDIDDDSPDSKGASNSCTFFCEQISHHPPISCSTVYNKEAGIYVSYHDQVKSTFMGTYAKLSFEGTVRIRFDKYNEVYTGTCPSMAVRIFRSFSEYVGKSKLTVNTSSLKCKSVFHPKPLLYGSYNTFDTTIYNGKDKIFKIKGQWDEIAKISEYKKDDYKILWDRRTMKQGAMRGPEVLLPTDSSIVWKGVFEADKLDSGTSAKTITKEKTKVEEAQRKITAERKQKGEVWKPVYFEQDKNGFYFLKNYKSQN